MCQCTNVQSRVYKYIIDVCIYSGICLENFEQYLNEGKKKAKRVNMIICVIFAINNAYITYRIGKIGFYLCIIYIHI